MPSNVTRNVKEINQVPTPGDPNSLHVINKFHGKPLKSRGVKLQSLLAVKIYIKRTDSPPSRTP